MNNDDPQSRDSRAEQAEYRGLGSDIAIALTTAVAGGATPPLVENFLNRPPKEEPPSVVLPPGVSKD